eukprot:m.184310 g.184310  ORF g.184310 m.184310 type:complete len:330 (+) comp10506_c5_seq1:84-1073(+)
MAREAAHFARNYWTSYSQKRYWRKGLAACDHAKAERMRWPRRRTRSRMRRKKDGEPMIVVLAAARLRLPAASSRGTIEGSEPRLRAVRAGVGPTQARCESPGSSRGAVSVSGAALGALTSCSSSTSSSIGSGSSATSTSTSVTRWGETADSALAELVTLAKRRWAAIGSVPNSMADVPTASVAGLLGACRGTAGREVDETRSAAAAASLSSSSSWAAIEAAARRASDPRLVTSSALSVLQTRSKRRRTSARRWRRASRAAADAVLPVLPMLVVLALRAASAPRGGVVLDRVVVSDAGPPAVPGRPGADDMSAAGAEEMPGADGAGSGAG